MNKTIASKVPEEVHQKLKMYCVQNKVEQKTVIKEAIMFYIEKNKRLKAATKNCNEK